MTDAKHLILYVDDDPDLLEATRLRLEKAGYGVITASSAEEGLKAYKAHGPDFLLVDLMMEEVDAGTNLVKELKLLGNRAPVYVLSSVGDQLSQVTDYAELGLQGVFQKPVNFDSLLRTLKAKLG
jgi:DNA-binding response OmpR family regulator